MNIVNIINIGLGENGSNSLYEIQSSYFEHRSFYEASFIWAPDELQEFQLSNGFTVQILPADPVPPRSFALRELISDLSLRILLAARLRLKVQIVFWSTVPRQLICFSQFLKGRAACI
jgi:hypothetical protein